MNLKIIIFSILLLFIINCRENDKNTISSEESQYSISGYIYDSIFRTHIDSVQISITEKSVHTLSDKSGYYKITNLYPGDYEFIISKNGYHGDSITIKIEESDLTQQAIFIRPIGLFANTLHNEYSVVDTITLQIYNYTNKNTLFIWRDFRLIHYVEIKRDYVWQLHHFWTDLVGIYTYYKTIQIKPDSVYFERYMLWPEYDGMEEGLYRLKFPFNWNDLGGITDSLISNEFRVSKVN